MYTQRNPILVYCIDRECLNCFFSSSSSHSSYHQNKQVARITQILFFVLQRTMPSNKNSQVYLTGSFAAIGGLLFGYDTGVISGVLTMSDFLLAFGGTSSLVRGSLPSSVAGSIVGIMLVGCFLGALIAGPSGDQLSRKYSIVLFSLIFIVSAVLQTGSYNLFMLLLSRLVAGKEISIVNSNLFHLKSFVSFKE